MRRLPISLGLLIVPLSARVVSATTIAVDFSFDVASITDSRFGNPVVSNPYQVATGDQVNVAMILDLNAAHFGSAYYDVLQSLALSVHGQTFTATFPPQDNQVDAGFADATNGDIWNYIYVPANVDPTHLGSSLFEFRDPTQTASIGVSPLPFEQWTGEADALNFVLWDPSATNALQNGYRISGDPLSLTVPTSVPEPRVVVLLGTGLSLMCAVRFAEASCQRIAGTLNDFHSTQARNHPHPLAVHPAP